MPIGRAFTAIGAGPWGSARWRAMSGADLVNRGSAVPTVIGVAAAGLFWWL
jgi:hypothetical protein